MKKYEPIKKSQLEINYGIETVYTLIICAIGVNLTACGIALLFSKTTYIYLIVLGIVIGISGLFFFIHHRLQSIDKKMRISGFILYNNKTKEIMRIPGYTISERMWNYISYCGDSEIKNTWEKNTISQANIKVDADNLFVTGGEKTESDILICELLEYYILKRLSDSMSLYYDSFNEKEIYTLTKDTIPESFMENRFLRWISEKKEIVKAPNTKIIQLIQDRTDAGKGRRVIAESVIGDSVNMYELFELILPKRGRIDIHDHCITVKHSLFSLEIRYDYPASSASIPVHFVPWYLGIDETNKELYSVNFNVSIRVKYKYQAFLSRKAHKYYTWIDGFVNNLYEDLSQERFFESIGWNTTNSVIECLQKLPIVQIQGVTKQKE